MAASPLALAIGQHVGHQTRLPAIHLFDFIQAQQCIVAATGDPFYGVTGGPPCVSECLGAVYAGSGHHDGGFAIGTFAFQVETATLDPNQR